MYRHRRQRLLKNLVSPVHRESGVYSDKAQRGCTTRASVRGTREAEGLGGPINAIRGPQSRRDFAYTSSHAWQFPAVVPGVGGTNSGAVFVPARCQEGSGPPPACFRPGPKGLSRGNSSPAGDGNPQFVAGLREQSHRLGLDSDILWPGFLRGDHKRAVLSDSHIFVLPSYSENFGVAVVEAMGASLPVIVSDQVGIHREISATNAGLVVTCSVEQIESALMKAVRDAPLRARMGANGASRPSNSRPKSSLERSVKHMPESEFILASPPSRSPASRTELSRITAVVLTFNEERNLESLSSVDCTADHIDSGRRLWKRRPYRGDRETMRGCIHRASLQRRSHTRQWQWALKQVTPSDGVDSCAGC